MTSTDLDNQGLTRTTSALRRVQRGEWGDWRLIGVRPPLLEHRLEGQRMHACLASSAPELGAQVAKAVSDGMPDVGDLARAFADLLVVAGLQARILHELESDNE